MCVWDRLSEEDFWKDFLNYKIEKQHLLEKEQSVIRDYIGDRRYLEIIADIRKEDYIPPTPYKKEISKADTDKKRVIYSFDSDFNLLLKGLAFYLYVYDSEFADNCYAFRRNFGVKDAVRRIKGIKDIDSKWCLKLDIQNYFNSIDVDILLGKLDFIKQDDKELYAFLKKLLTLDKAYVDDDAEKRNHKNEDVNNNDIAAYRIITGKRGAMAGTPVSPFLANVFLSDMDKIFEDALYFRYSDDILIFADSEDELKKYQKKIYSMIESNKLTLNQKKVKVCKPGEVFEFLGFSYNSGEIDLSENTVNKMKAKIKRKAHALRRWANRNKHSGERAARAFIKAMNKKLFDDYYRDKNGSGFSWSRWFFPCLTTDRSLNILDDYMQSYIRFCVTGRHYKGNYKISYDTLKAWGYRNIVNEYWNGRKQS